MSACLPCDLEDAAAAEIMFRNDIWSCEIAGGYDVPGWYILRLRRHAEGWSGPAPEELATFGLVSQQLADAIQAATGAPTVYFMSFGENYPHFHFLVIARDAELPAESRGAAILSQRAEGRDMAESLRVGEQVRSAFAASPH